MSVRDFLSNFDEADFDQKDMSILNQRMSNNMDHNFANVVMIKHHSDGQNDAWRFTGIVQAIRQNGEVYISSPAVEDWFHPHELRPATSEEIEAWWRNLE